jgi:FtsZ-binding cell division protein ZapB
LGSICKEVDLLRVGNRALSDEVASLNAQREIAQGLTKENEQLKTTLSATRAELTLLRVANKTLKTELEIIEHAGVAYV